MAVVGVDSEQPCHHLPGCHSCHPHHLTNIVSWNIFCVPSCKIFFCCIFNYFLGQIFLELSANWQIPTSFILYSKSLAVENPNFPPIESSFTIHPIIGFKSINLDLNRALHYESRPGYILPSPFSIALWIKAKIYPTVSFALHFESKPRAILSSLQYLLVCAVWLDVLLVCHCSCIHHIFDILMTSPPLQYADQYMPHHYLYCLSDLQSIHVRARDPT